MLVASRERPAAAGGSALQRYRQVAAVLMKHGLADVVDALHLGRYLAAGTRLLPARSRIDPSLSRSARLRLTFEELGPIGSLVVASSVVIQSGIGGTIAGYPALGLAGFVIAGVLGIGLAIGIVRSGRL